ncbi:phosphate/phosphite/phosphonate ABC transporter substrate-binding protein [Natrarchaeobius halalkaliphilus]|uniref:Phosphate/phosphite/phosphonate ABC transporter substrate-binding protein n=1 Tax=Natrarchaeobius halalkaliphilus TaxID=1679091 RepID=A0A3N6LMH3_9EURY|nr:phosphate/phosphite/phosphonate ABC transporter substrate-binding protein [Natrarchaeobius halalkaliphilus]RQG86735.1 phosphate/phosphite/phosphonate ABC transporter substrate-binding protein [Natrarchaeobius halalkaliphilus]
MPVNNRRRNLLMGTGAAFMSGLAGCVGGDDDSGSGGNGDSTGNGTGNGGGTEFEDFDPDNPVFPQMAPTLLDEGFEVANINELDNFEERDEPRYGNPHPEPPESSDEWIDPDTIVMSLVPSEDPGVYEDLMDPIRENVEAETGKDTEFHGLTSYAAQVEAMRADRLHTCGFGTGAVPFAVNMAGAVPFAIQVAEDTFGYKLWVVTQANNDEINSLDDLEGKSVAHTDPASNSGNLAPRAWFTDEGVEPDEDYDVEYSGSHENSILGVQHGDYEAAPVASTVVERASREGAADADELKVVYNSVPFVTTGFTYKYNLHPDIREGIRNAYLEYDYMDTELAEYYDGRGRWVEIDYASHWDAVLSIQEYNEVEYVEDQI